MMDIVTLAIAVFIVFAYFYYRATGVNYGASCPHGSSCTACPGGSACKWRLETLARVPAGSMFRLSCVDDEIVRSQLLRLGLDPGQPLFCDFVVPGGPVVVKRGRQQIAIGRSLAERITVELPMS